MSPWRHMKEAEAPQTLNSLQSAFRASFGLTQIQGLTVTIRGRHPASGFGLLWGRLAIQPGCAPFIFTAPPARGRPAQALLGPITHACGLSQEPPSVG